jgi:hypothetical protein
MSYNNEGCPEGHPFNFCTAAVMTTKQDLSIKLGDPSLRSG